MPELSAASEPLLSVQGLKVAFALHAGKEKNWNEVVKGVDLKLYRGKTLALVGESGSGKSVISQSIMNILPGNARMEAGRIIFSDAACGSNSINIAALDPEGKEMRSLRGGRISMIFQEPMSSLAPVYTIGNQISESLYLHRPDEAHNKVTVRALTEEMLHKVGFHNPKQDYDKFPFELSGGLRQRAMLAMAMICNPALLIADEPTTALDVTVQRQILKLMRDMQAARNMGLLLITHDLGVVANMADEVAVIYHGQIMESGSVEDIFLRPQHAYVKALLKATPHFDMVPGERLVSLRDIKTDLSALGMKQRPQIAFQGPLLHVSDICKNFGSVNGPQSAATKAVDGVSLTLQKGECLGLVGESGCGKTTLSKCLMRAVRPDSGSIIFHNGSKNIDLLKLDGDDLRKFRPHIQMIFQDPVSSLSPRMTVADIIREPLDVQNIGSVPERNERVKQLLKAVGLDPRFLNRYPHSFSGGQRQRIGIARALAQQPEIIVCDEAVSALDVSVQAQVLNLLKDLQSQLGLTYLFISHNLAVVGYIAQNIAVMARGRIVEWAPRELLFKAPCHPYTRQLLQSVPFADLGHRFDLNETPKFSPSDPNFWPEEFQPMNGQLEPFELGGGHFVLTRPGAKIERRVGS